MESLEDYTEKLRLVAQQITHREITLKNLTDKLKQMLTDDQPTKEAN